MGFRLKNVEHHRFIMKLIHRLSNVLYRVFTVVVVCCSFSFVQIMRNGQPFGTTSHNFIRGIFKVENAMEAASTSCSAGYFEF